ncbi:MAG: hypothetical protein IPJ65_38200 [Archangiaceae bacterium]|nr:hypothetical protein [Archangiaceae bacterium]
MRISLCTSRSDPKSTRIDIAFTALQDNTTPLPKDRAPMWSPCSFKDDSRLEANAYEVSTLVLDFDNGRPDSKLLRALNVTHLWHTSASHTPETPKWRLIIELDAPISAKAWPTFWENAVHALQLSGCDSACKNVGRFYYLAPTTATWESFQGRPLPTQEIKAPPVDDLSKLRRCMLAAKNPEYISVIRQALAGQPMAGEGARDTTVNGLGFYLGRSVVPQGTSFEAVLTLLGAGLVMPGDESREHWEGKLRAAYERGMLKRSEKTEETVKAQGLDAPWAKALQLATRLDGSVSVLSNAFNASIILVNGGVWRFRHNLLEDSLEISEGDEEFRALTDPDTTAISNWFQQTYRLSISRQLVYDQIAAVADEYDPLRTYLDGLHWDGVNRIDSFLQEYLGVEDTAQARLYSRKFLIAMVARALNPGCKMDNVLVLQGAQGLGKSTGLRMMGEPWFSDSKVVVGDKDSLLSASRFWIHEFAELASLRRADLETIKAFFTSTTDAYRPPYGRVLVTRPRRCIFVATTNEAEFLQDETGLRRFWVVSCNRPVNFAKVQADRGLLLAEAKQAFMSGEHWWLEGEEENALQASTASEYALSGTDGARSQAIVKWWVAMPANVRPKHLTTSTVVLDIWGVPLERANSAYTHEAARVLRGLKWVRYMASEDGRRVRAFRPPAEWENLPQRRGSEVLSFKEVG